MLQTLVCITQGVRIDRCNSISMDVCTKQWIGFHNVPAELNMGNKFVYLKKKKFQEVRLNFQSLVYYLCQEVPKFNVSVIYIQTLLPWSSPHSYALVFMGGKNMNYALSVYSEI